MLARIALVLVGASAWLGMSLGGGPPLRADEPDGGPGSTLIRESQIQIRIGDRQFQGTVIARDGDLLTILTAAHCLGPEDEGTSFLMRQGDQESLGGEVVEVARNPDYRPILAQNGTVQGVLCVDNAIAVLRVKPVGATQAARLLAIRPAVLAPWSALGSGRRVVTIHILDQYGQVHAPRAGNHLNPKCLAWGHGSYRPARGDSGAGVFLMVEAAGGGVRPLLIGNLAISDDRGGIAPLVSRRDLWVDFAPEKAATSGRP